MLRNHRTSDLPFLTEMWFDAENGKYLSDPTAEFVNDVYQRVLDDLENSRDGYYLVAETVQDGVPVGSAGIFPTADGVCDIGYCVHKSRWRQGFGSEIVALLVEWSTAQGAEKVTAEVAIENLPSNLLLQRFGFSVEKKSSFQKYNMGVRFDSYIYARKTERQAKG